MELMSDLCHVAHSALLERGLEAGRARVWERDQHGWLERKLVFYHPPAQLPISSVPGKRATAHAGAVPTHRDLLSPVCSPTSSFIRIHGMPTGSCQKFFLSKTSLEVCSKCVPKAEFFPTFGRSRCNPFAPTPASKERRKSSTLDFSVINDKHP